MTEQNDQPVQQEAEGQVESKIASKFQAAREATMNESAQLSEIYRSITKPGFKDVYSAWVKNMDTVANSYSWGKDKQTLKTKIIKIQNRVVGTVAAGLTVPTDFFVDIATLPFRKLPILKQTVGHFIPTHYFAQHSVLMSERAKTEAFAWRGIGQVVKGVAKIPEAYATVGGEVFKRLSVGKPLPEARAAWQYMEKKINGVTDAILHPKPKAI